MSATKSDAPVNDQRMWRRLLARAHPDQGGDEELFVWAQTVREEVEIGPSIADALHGAFYGSAAPPRPSPKKTKPKGYKDRFAPENRSKQRVIFETGLAFDKITEKAIALADELSTESYGRIFRLLEGVEYPAGNPDLEAEAATGAAYWRLADIGRAFDMGGDGRGAIYKVACDSPLSGYHARYLLEEVERLVERDPDLAAEIGEAVPSQGG